MLVIIIICYRIKIIPLLHINLCIFCMQFSTYRKWLPIYFMHFHWNGLSTRSLIAELKFDTARTRDGKSHEPQWMNCQQLKQFASANCTFLIWLFWFAWRNPIHCFFSLMFFISTLIVWRALHQIERGGGVVINSISLNYKKVCDPLNFIFNTFIRKTINNSCDSTHSSMGKEKTEGNWMETRKALCSVRNV